MSFDEVAARLSEARPGAPTSWARTSGSSRRTVRIREDKIETIIFSHEIKFIQKQIRKSRKKNVKLWKVKSRILNPLIVF